MMLGPAELSALIASLQGAKDIAQSMINVRDTEAFQSKVVEFQAAIIQTQAAAMVAQDECSALIERVRQLEKEVADMEAWETEKKRYELQEVGNRALTYVLKPECQGSEPIHCLCAQCYQHGQKSILQPETRSPGQTSWMACYECGADLCVGGTRDMTYSPRFPVSASSPKRR